MVVTRRDILTRWALLACIVGVAALTSEAADWQPVSLVLGLGVVMVIADAPVVWTRRLRVSSGTMVQATIMALLGPAPAVAIGLFGTIIDAVVNRVAHLFVVLNLITAAVLGLAGGVLFEVLGERFDLDRNDSAYALLVLPVYTVLIVIGLALIAGLNPEVPPSERRRVVRDSALPGVRFELVCGVFTSVAVLAWPGVGLAIAPGLMVAQLLMIPLARTVGEALRSDERASEIERLSSDRDRLLSEVLQAESRERARLAESLHDGPMQRLSALRQDAVEERRTTVQLDAAIAETRAIISAFHPATVRELGFEASLRAAVAPFPAARSVALTVSGADGDAALTGSILLPVAQELVVNAVKHAGPTAIDVVVGRHDGHLVLEVNDDGVGIDSERAGRAVQAGHVGLAMVRRRVQDAGGTLEIATRDDGGTRSRVTLPESRMAPG